jgi:hypothetical protein
MATDRFFSNVSHHKAFTSPLRHYTGVWCLFVAALPVLMTRFRLIPVYESQKSLLPAYASFFCLMVLAYVFSQRHRMARAMFEARLLWGDLDAVQSKAAKRMSINGGLAAMILGALGCAAIYLWAFESGRTSRDFPTLPPSSMNAVLLAVSYITLFLLASASFAVVAVREHMQHVLGLSDAEVITGLPRTAELTTSATPSAARHGSITVLSERGGGARVSAGGDNERFSGEEQFKSESNPAIRTGATDPSRL